MKKPNDPLHRLITSMTPSEKRYYKLHFVQSEGLLKDLYEIVNKMEVYDQALVKKRLGEASKNLKVHKIQLTELLLKSLTVFHSKKSVYSKIRIGLEEVDLLIDKELYGMASDRLKKLGKLCLEYQEYAYLLEIADREFRLNHIHFDKLGQSVKPIYERLRSYISSLEEQYRYAELGNEILEEKRKYELRAFPPEVVAYCQRMLEEDFLNPSYKPRSIYGEIHRNTLLVFLNDVVGDTQTSLKYRKSNADIFRGNPKLARHPSFDYLNTLRNLVNMHSQRGEFSEAEKIIEEARAFAAKNKIQREQMVYFLYAEMVIAYERGNFERIEQTIAPEMEAHLQRYDITQDRIGLVAFLYLAITNLLLGNFVETHQYLRELNLATKDLRHYFAEIYTIVELISHYESKEYTLLKNLAQAKNRQLSRIENVSPFYRAILKLLKKIANQPFEAATQAAQLRARLSDFESDKVLGMFLYFKLDNWLKALEKKQPFRRQMQ